MAEEEVKEIKGKDIGGFIKEQFRKFVLPEFKQCLDGLKIVFKPKKFFSKGIFSIPYFINVIALVVFGLAVHYSASYQTLKQLIFAVVGIILMVFISQFSTEAIKQLSNAAMAVATVTLLLVFFAPEVNGTHRWFFGNLFQPSELAKITFIMFMAYLLDKYSAKKDKYSSFWAFIIITGVYAALVLLESHLSGCILFLCIGYAMMWFADMPKKAFALVTAAVVVVFGIVVLKPEILKAVPFIHDYQVDRIVIWKKVLFHQDTVTAKEKLDNARQVLQSLYGIGSGGLTGVGYGKSGQKISNLSEKANDFIFAVIGEELGFVGGIIMLLIYGFLVYQGIKIALRAKTYYGALLVLGISVQIALQVLINVAVATSLLPNTGISLPFFSEGGSSMLFTLVSMGFVLAVSKDGKGDSKVTDKEKSKGEVKDAEQ